MRPATLFRRPMLLAALGVAALGAGTSRATAGAFLQSDLVSDIRRPGGRYQFFAEELVGRFAQRDEPVLGLGSSDRRGHSLQCHRCRRRQSAAYGHDPDHGNWTAGTHRPGQQFHQRPSWWARHRPISSSPTSTAPSPPGIRAWGRWHRSRQPRAGALYTGLAIDATSTRLFAANGSQDRIDVFNGSFAPVSLGANAFKDPLLPAGLVPFNVQNINGQIYVLTRPPAGRPRSRPPRG